MQFQEDKTREKLETLRKKEEEDSTKILSTKYQLPYLNLTTFPVEAEALKIIPEDKARLAEIAVIQSVGKKLKVAVRNPERDSTSAVVKKLQEGGYQTELYLVSLTGLQHAWEFYKKVIKEVSSEAGTISVHKEKISSLTSEIKNVQSIKSLIDNMPAGQTTEILEVIIAGALALDASDVHIEAQKDSARLRYRLDGVLGDVTSLENKLYNLLVSRIKLISDLLLNIKDKAQDGRFTIKTDGDEIEVRTSTLPGPYGENIVLRILNPKNLGVTFENLGMQPWITEALDKELKKPNGMILTTGPTGSGKTTTLYAFLKKVHTPDIKIITLEDPIEYHLLGMEQTQIDAAKGYDFASGLRAILRQDPDVILVGEIRDKETAETAMHAALTGHLVFSTLHTNNAPATIPRLLDLGIKPAIITPALNAALAQRLVRKLCPECKVKKNLNEEEKRNIKKELELFPKGIQIPASETWTVFKSNTNGCDKCHQGYKGRIGVYELLLIDEQIEGLIMKEAAESEIKKAAANQGQITVRQDGLLKVLSGIIDFEELSRSVGEE